MNSTITSGRYKVLDAGAVFSFANNPLKIAIREGTSNEIVFNVQFTFEVDQSRPKFHVEIRAIPEDHCSNVRLFNYDNAIGAGIVNPFQIATGPNGSKLWISFLVSAWSGSLGKKIEYTIFKEEGDENGNPW